MRLITIVTGLVLMIGCVNTIFAQADFRDLNWGASKGSVKEKEKCPLISEAPARIVYNCPLADTEGKVVYTFTSSDKLMRAKYLLTPDYFNTIFYIRDFRMYEELLTQKYGKPIIVSPKVINKQSIKEDEWAAYLSAGELIVEARWMSGKTEIQLTMSKLDTYPAIQIDYISNEYSKQDLQEKSKQILKAL